MNYAYVEPEVAGGLGEETEIEVIDGRTEVRRVQYEFDGWLGDCLLTSHPIFIATSSACEGLSNEDIVGVSFGSLRITTSDLFRELHPNFDLPSFRLLDVKGRSGVDDFGIALDQRLVLSSRAIDILRRYGLNNAKIESYP